MLDDLYQDLIFEYASRATHHGSLDEPFLRSDLRNPLCGDVISLYARVKDDTLAAIKFSCEGCIISRAAAALMVEHTLGKRIVDVETVLNDFYQLIQIDVDAIQLERLGDLGLLGGVRKFPARTRCALLAFEALQSLLAKR